MRTIAVFLGALVVAFSVDLLLGHFVTPDSDKLIAQIFSTDPGGPQWPELWRQWHRVNMFSLYLITPAAGLLCGAFIGLLQKNHVVLVAAVSEIPQFVELLWADHAKIWAHSLYGILIFLANLSLPFLTAMLAAWLCHRWLIQSNRVVQQLS